MLYKGADCVYIRDRVKSKKDVAFDVEKENTAFNNNQAPIDWQEVPLTQLGKEDLIRIMSILPLDQSLRASFHRLEIIATELGGSIYYKEKGPSLVSVKINW